MVSQATAPAEVYRARDTRHQSWRFVTLPAECCPISLVTIVSRSPLLGNFQEEGRDRYWPYAVNSHYERTDAFNAATFRVFSVMDPQRIHLHTAESHRMRE
jgi:hypothetical protein